MSTDENIPGLLTDPPVSVIFGFGFAPCVVLDGLITNIYLRYINHPKLIKQNLDRIQIMHVSVNNIVIKVNHHENPFIPNILNIQVIES